MEYAVYINDINKLDEIKGSLKKGRISRLYYAEEFCEYRIPGIREVREALRFAGAEKLKFTYLTAELPQRYLDTQCAVLEYLNKQGVSIEIVFNDWGVLHLLHTQFTGLIPVMGRLLFKSSRMPRFTVQKPNPDPHLLNNRNVFEVQMRILRQSNLSVPIYRSFLKKYKINRIECDLLAQGLHLNKKWGFRYSFYTPYSYVTGARTCELAGIWQKEKAVYITPETCLMPCKKFYLEFKANTAMLPLRQFANSVFFENTTLVKQYLRQNLFDRCIIEYCL